jgi:riboflavin kinase / FMN adenylyltransferase
MQPSFLEGTVTRFSGNGRKLGYPTANVMTETRLSDGVYFGFASLDKYAGHPALIFIGTPTTVGDKERRTEAHLLDIEDKDYYGLKLELELCYYHRHNKTFGSIEELIQEMRADEIAARKWFTDINATALRSAK